MDKETLFSGVTATPSDYNAPDGQLALAQNLVPEDGTLKPVLPPAEIMQIPAGQKLLHIHKNNDYTNFIFYRQETGVLSFRTIGDENYHDIGMLQSSVKRIESVGHTLMVFTDEGIFYFLYKGDKKGYLTLGNHIPELSVSFGLQGTVEVSEKAIIDFNTFNTKFYKYQVDESGRKDVHDFSDDQKKDITSPVLAQVNKFINERVTQKGRFIFPFFARYAYRLFDGSLTMHSAPVLMVASTEVVPKVSCTDIEWGNIGNTERDIYISRMKIVVAAVLHNLDYQIMSAQKLEKLKIWKDIVTSIEIFISQPVWTYDQSGYCKRFESVTIDDSVCICKHLNQSFAFQGEGGNSGLKDEDYPLRYQNQTYSKLFRFSEAVLTDGLRIKLPEVSKDKLEEQISKSSPFYFLKRISLDKAVANKRELIEIDDDYLPSLVNREVMTDEYESHDQIIPSTSFAYNGRLNLASIKKTLFRGFDANSLFTFTDGYVWPVDKGSSDKPTANDNVSKFVVYVFINQDNKDIVVQSPEGTLCKNEHLLYFYYPNANAYKALIVIDDKPTYTIPLKRHDFLNGAYFFNGWNGMKTFAYMRPSDIPEVSSEQKIELPNKIYTSEVNNPFYFPATGINTVGSGHILGLSSTVKALSQGQFGQFPLYAFTDEGVWALKLNEKGSYEAVQPVSRDVCNNPDSITQIDTAVLFTTDRGVMLVQGSETVCISDSITGLSYLPVTQLPAFPAVLREAGLEGLELSPFSEFSVDCRMLYDYRHQRIILYSPKHAYAYIYSLRSKLWGMMDSAIQYSVNAWPDAMAVAAIHNPADAGNSPEPDGATVLMNFSAATGQPYPALAVTRPLKFDAPDVFKTLTAVIQRGFFRRGNVKTVLWGSNDLTRWVLVWSSVDHVLRGFAGTPYKFYRLASIASLSPDETLTGFNTRGIPRLTNDLR